MKFGDAWDLTRPGAQRLVRAWLRSGLIWGVHLGTPCGTWSRARDRGPVRVVGGPPGWPGRLRSAEHPWGLPEVQHPRDVAALAAGNALAKFSISVARQCRNLEIPFGIENPFSSRLWTLPGMRAIRGWPHAFWACTDFCQDGVPWRKPTGLLGYRVNMHDAARQCSGRGRCSRTGRPHHQLVGSSPSGKMWTAVAEPYPPKLAARLASAYVSGRFITDSAHVSMLIN